MGNFGITINSSASACWRLRTVTFCRPWPFAYPSRIATGSTPYTVTKHYQLLFVGDIWHIEPLARLFDLILVFESRVKMLVICWCILTLFSQVIRGKQQRHWRNVVVIMVSLPTWKLGKYTPWLCVEFEFATMHNALCRSQPANKPTKLIHDLVEARPLR